MPRAYRTITIVLVAVMLLTTAVPSMTVYAQDGDEGTCSGTGIFYWPCRLIDGILNGILNFFNWAINAVSTVFRLIGDVITFIGTLIQRVVQFLVDLVRFIFDFMSRVVEFINEAIQIVGLIIEIVRGMISALAALVWQALNQVFGFLGDFFGSVPTAIPGAPPCGTTPLSSDFCAFPYLIDNTIFGAPNGSIAVSIILIIIDVSVVFIFARRVLTLLRMGESVTNV